MNSHCVEISIAGGVVDMVCGPNPNSLFFSSFFLFFIMRLLIFRYKKLHAALAME